MELNYELCEKCEESMKAALEGAGGPFGLTVQEMYEQEAEFHFDLAFALLSEGHYLVRKSEADNPNPKVVAIIETKESCEENPDYQVGVIDLETDNIVSYTTFTNKELFAGDWTIAKIKE